MRPCSLLLLVPFAGCAEVPAAPGSASPAPAPSATAGFTNPQGYDDWRAMRWADESGRQPTGEQRAAAHAAARANAEHFAQIESPDLQRTSWVPHGPDNVGGRTRALVIDPARPYRMWAGACGGGVWRSDNYGASWTKLDDRMGNLVIGCLAMDPNDSAVMYAGTGEGFAGSSVRSTGVGIWKTTDGGDTWAVLANTVAFGNVSRIAIAPVNSSVVIASTSTGVRRSTDGGTNWTTVITGVTSQQVLFDPNDGNRCIAHVQLTANNAATVRVSNDAGATWLNTTYANGTARIELAYAKATPNLVFAAVGVGAGEFWRSTDGGNTWNWMAATGMAGVGAQMNYNNCVWVDPTNSNLIVVGWVKIYRSTNGGASFTVISDGGGYVIDEDAPHADTHLLVADPGYNGTTNKTLYCGNDGGIYRTSDITTVTTTSGWSRRKNFYPATQFMGVAGHGAGRLIGGTQDNGSFAVTTTSSTAVRLSGGDGGYCAIDPTNPRLTYTTTQNRGIWRHNGTAETSISGNVGEVGTGTCTGFVTPLELDPGNRTRLYSGGCSLWRTNDATASPPVWTAAKASTGVVITAIAIAPSNSDIVWVGHGDGSVYRTANATAATPTWVTVDDGGSVGGLPNRSVNTIRIHRNNPSEVLVGVGGFVAGNLLRTTDSGTNWSVVTGSGIGTLPNAPIYAIAQHPVLQDRYYVATEVGVFDSQDDCATWSTSNEGPTDCAAADIDFIPGTTTLLLGTHGRGLWTAELSVPGARNLGIGCAGSNGTPFLSASTPRIGQSSTVTLNGTVFGQPVYLLQGLSKWSWFGNLLPFDMAPFGAAGCMLRVSPDILREWSLQAQGSLQLALPIANHPALVGQQFYLQAIVVDPAANAFGHTFSNGVHMTIDT